MDGRNRHLVGSIGQQWLQGHTAAFPRSHDCLLGAGVRNRTVGDSVVLYAALGGLPMDLEAGGALRVYEEVGGWAPRSGSVLNGNCVTSSTIFVVGPDGYFVVCVLLQAWQDCSCRISSDGELQQGKK